jgi:fructose-bisphosphate aldolase class I
MNEYAQAMRETAVALVAPGKGILAMDESNATCNKRFEALSIPTTEERRRAYREMILTTPKLSDYVSGAILYDETIRQSTKTGKPFTQVMQDAGLIIGIKVDAGAKPLVGCPRETVTEGLDGLTDRVADYYQMGARFAKWRAVIRITPTTPTTACIEANAHALARYAAICQAGGLVPIVEPEVLFDGNHSIDRCYDVTTVVLQAVLHQLRQQQVALDQIILKPSMVIHGVDAEVQASANQIADLTVECLRQNVPAIVAGIAFLSGGQTNEQASLNLSLMNERHRQQCPWPLTFSYARAIQQAALEAWRGNDENVLVAQQLLHYRASLNSAASRGEYRLEMEKSLAFV